MKRRANRNRSPGNCNPMAHNAYIARQPIVDDKHQLIAYELLFRHAPHAAAARVEDAAAAGIETISNLLCNMGTDWLLGGKLAFINLDSRLLLSELPDLLPPDRVVLEVLETVEVTPQVIERLAALRQSGYRIALDDYVYTPERAELLPLAHYVKLDVLTHPGEGIVATVKAARQHGLKLLAEKVEKREQFERYKQLGFELFQGYYFARPENLSAKVVNPTQATVLQLMEKVRQEADVKQIEEGFKRDVALTFKLLRYINSAAFGLNCEIQSIRHAVSILGYRPLAKWLTLLLATASPSPTAPVLTRTAITRGRLCELLGAHHLSKSEQDNLFITGVFSLLDALLESPMDQVLERIALPESVVDALLSRSGIYGPILALAEACESGDASRIESIAESLFLSPDQVNEAHLKALAWVEQIGLE
jgi:EAL and modified HD-GYP domain-containing signal transduction protein